MVLLVWLFALASGMANACLVQERATGGHGQAAHNSDTAGGTKALAGQGSATTEHGDAWQPSSAACLEVCDQVSQAPVQHQNLLDADDPGPAPLHMVAWAAQAPAADPMPRTPDTRRAIGLPPIRVKYVRLAL